MSNSKIALIVIGVLLLIPVTWGASVLLSNVTGAGGAIKQKNSTVNRIQQQEQFEDLVADYDGYLVNIKIANSTLKADSNDTMQKSIDTTNLEGLKIECVDAAQQFNANSQKYTAREWKSAGLPARLDPNLCT